jgi:hypothetical protein
MKVKMLVKMNVQILAKFPIHKKEGVLREISPHA